MAKPLLYRFRVPRADQRVMAALRVGEQQPWVTSRGSGVDIADVYVILTRLVKAGWAEFRQEGWEDLGREERRFYRLTDTGHAQVTAILGVQDAPASQEN